MYRRLHLSYHCTDELAHTLQSQIAHLQSRLSDEHARSIRYETSWRGAEDRVATSQFELENLKAEIKELKGEGK
jgi:chromosome segregation ATPase